MNVKNARSAIWDIRQCKHISNGCVIAFENALSGRSSTSDVEHTTTAVIMAVHKVIDNKPPKCPKCKVDMVLRRSSQGSFFWGCVNYGKTSCTCTDSAPFDAQHVRREALREKKKARANSIIDDVKDWDQFTFETEKKKKSRANILYGSPIAANAARRREHLRELYFALARDACIAVIEENEQD